MLFLSPLSYLLSPLLPAHLHIGLVIVVGDQAVGDFGKAMLFIEDPGALIALGRIDAATKTVARAVKVVKKHPLIDFRQAQIAWRRGEARALGALVKFARSSPTNVEAWREVRAAAKTSRDRKLEKEATAKLRNLGDLGKK